MTLDPVERLDRDGILALQRAKLHKLGERLENHAEWRAHFAQAGLSPRDLSAPDGLAHAPMLDKAALRQRYPFPFLTVPPERIARFVAPSGTTGLPVLFGLGHRDVDVLLPRQLARIFRATGVAPGDRVYQGYGYGLWIGGVAMDIGLKAYGAVNFGIGPGRGELVVEWLRDHAYTACTLSPLWLMTLVATAARRGMDPRQDWRLRIGLFGGQSISLGFRTELEAAMPPGFVAHNIYGSTEAGGPVVGISCPHSHADDEMHLINDDTILTEIRDPVTHSPVGPGEIGEIVVTTLEKEGSPVLRWRTGDLVRLSRRPFDCPCGRHGLPRIGRIIGRSDDMLKVRGAMVFPSQVEDVIAALDGTVKEAWQIYVERTSGVLEGLTVAVERRHGARAGASEIQVALRDALQARLGIRCGVECHEEGTLPRYESKATRVLTRDAAVRHG